MVCNRNLLAGAAEGVVIEVAVVVGAGVAPGVPAEAEEQGVQMLATASRTMKKQAAVPTIELLQTSPRREA
jgi:hypothetical protein